MTTTAPQTVWLIEDNATLRRTVARGIGALPGFRCTAKYQRCEDALADLRAHAVPAPDIVLLDVGLPGMSGLDGIALIKDLAPGTQVVILTVFDDDEKIYRAICAGASGYLLKGTPLAELATALTDVRRGGSPMTPRVARRVLEMFSNLAPRVSTAPGLSPRERQIIEGMADGLTNKEIAARLGLSAHTTDDYTRAIYEKLHVNTRGGAVAKAMREGLV
ncbi:MAG: response regulator transcription factor [Opitutus sp.]|nr:response regulator transcription factor [Opitutus sp.]